MAFDLLDIQNDVYKYEASEGQMKEVTSNTTDSLDHPPADITDHLCEIPDQLNHP